MERAQQRTLNHLLSHTMAGKLKWTSETLTYDELVRSEVGIVVSPSVEEKAKALLKQSGFAPNDAVWKEYTTVFSLEIGVDMVAAVSTYLTDVAMLLGENESFKDDIISDSGPFLELFSAVNKQPILDDDLSNVEKALARRLMTEIDKQLATFVVANEGVIL